jgi:hypothetical protein
VVRLHVTPTVCIKKQKVWLLFVTSSERMKVLSSDRHQNSIH